MAVSQNICYKVVTIGWLKNFIGTKLQNSNGGTVYVGGSYDDSYCPTYLQLTNGSLLPYRSTSSSGPADDTDGITVNSICHATSQSYSSNQLVNIHDMAVCNTRLDSFTVSVDTSTIDGCNGGTRNLSYTRRFTRTTWDMLNCSSQETPSSSSSSVNDTRNSLISWSTNIGNITNSSSAGSGKAVSVGKNTPSSDSGSSSRTITVTGSSTFRGSTATDTASVGQSGVGGSYKYWYTTQVGQTNYRVTCSGGPSFGCEGGSYSAAAKHDYKDRTYYRWQDVCGVNYDSWNYYSDSSTYTTTDYTYSGSFPDISSAGGSNSDSWSKSGYAGSCSWSQSCSSPSTVYTYGTGTASAQGPCAGGSVTVSTDSMPYTATTGGASSTGVTSATLTVSVSECTNSSGCTTSSSGTASPGGTIHYTITQTGCSSACDCSKLTVEGGTSGPDAGNVELAYYSGDCLTNVSASVSESWITNTGFTSDKVLTGTVTSNGSTSSNRTATITITATECSGKTVTFTQEKAIDWSEKVCNFHVCLGDPEVQYEIRKDGSHSITSIGNWYAKYSAGTFSYEIVYEEPCTTGWVTFSQLSGTDADKVWNEIYAFEGSLANNALKHVFPGWVRGWLPAWRNGWLVPINITGTANNTGIERHAKVYLKMNGVTCCYFPVVQESNTVECPAMANVVTQMPIMQGVTADGGTITQGIKFYTGNTSFHSVGSITGLSNLTSVSWGSDAESGWKWLNIVVPANSSDSSRTCSFTINATVGDGGCKECTYDVSFTQLGRTASCDCSKLTVNGTIE